MNNKNFKFPDTSAYNFVINGLKEKGISLEDIADMAYDLQSVFFDNLTKEEMMKNTIKRDA
ncbi:hypothetical protein NBRC111893_1684 [Lentilactobacillus kosonis]|uniref:Uncharacterized protein n=1 Tax=Lentilactobacillus kosonis TaxID=2810561 RepID=A0A401FMQ3_9LACO|nr:hypothetical protein NBRC111893_1684 [Lentilactobacillus kosonis]